MVVDRALGQAAKLAGIGLGDFIDLCARLRVPVLWEPKTGAERIGAEVEALAAALDAADEPVSHGSR